MLYKYHKIEQTKHSLSLFLARGTSPYWGWVESLPHGDAGTQDPSDLRCRLFPGLTVLLLDSLHPAGRQKRGRIWDSRRGFLTGQA